MEGTQDVHIFKSPSTQPQMEKGMTTEEAIIFGLNDLIGADAENDLLIDTVTLGMWL